MILMYIILGLIAVLVIAGLVIPSPHSIARKNTIAAPPATAHAFVGEEVAGVDAVGAG